MKILFCNGSFALGGAERRLSQLIIGLHNAGYNEIYCILSNKQIAYPEILNASVKFYYLSPNRSKIETCRELYKTIRQISPDVIHTWSLRFAFYLNMVKPFIKFKYIYGAIISANRFKPTQRSYYWEKLSFAMSDCIVSNSIAGLKAKNAPLWKSHVIYNGFNFDRFDKLQPATKIRNEFQINTPFIITMASRIEPQKNILMYLKVAQRIQSIRKDVTFLLVGDGSQLPHYKHYTASNAINSVVFTGLRTDVETIIKSSDLCVLCSNHKEGVSNFIMESLAGERPMIATLGGGTDEIVVDGMNGYIVNPNDVESMAGKIDYLLNNPEKRRQMGISAKETVSHKFMLSSMVKQYIDLYNSL